MTNVINSFSYNDNIYTFTLPYGVCSTGAGATEKVVTVDNFSLEEGAVVIVKFTNKNDALNPTLNVNGTGAKPIYRYGTTNVSTETTSTGWIAGAILLFIYDGTGWIRDYWSNTTYSNASLGQGYATCSTAASTKEKTASLSSYSLITGGIVAIKFTNDVCADATLNINSKGAKKLYFRDAAITEDIIKAGDVATFIYDTNYHLISIDRWQNDITNIKTDLEELSTSIGEDLALKANITYVDEQNTQTLNSAKAYTDQEVAGLVNSAPETLDTLNELAQALGDDPNFATTIVNQIGLKMDKMNPTGTGSFSLNRKANTTIGLNSFAAGIEVTASGSTAHAEGTNTTASGYASHAEGQANEASGYTSHAEGLHTKASGGYQHVQGRYNVEDTESIYAHIVGNGDYDGQRSNAHTLDWEGNAWFAGDIYISSTSGINKDEGSKKLATEEFITTEINKIPQSDWNQNDENAQDYIKNKPFGEIIVSSNTITWDGERTDNSRVVTTNRQFDFYKISDAIVTADKLAEGGTYCLRPYSNMYGSDSVFTFTADSITDTGSALKLNSYVLFVYNTYIDLSTNIEYTPGVYFAFSVSIGRYVAYLTINGNDAFVVEEIKQIDEKYISGKMDKENPTGIGSFSLNRAANVVIGTKSFAAGNDVAAQGYASHAEGDSSVTVGDASHAEGYRSYSYGYASHAEGYLTKAYGTGAHAEGGNTITSANYSHVLGKYNIEDSAKTYAHIVGNGSGSGNNPRSNAHTLDWQGNAWFAGDIYVGSTSGRNKDDGSKKLATEEFITNEINTTITDYYTKSQIDSYEFITIADIDEICGKVIAEELPESQIDILMNNIK